MAGIFSLSCDEPVFIGFLRGSSPMTEPLEQLHRPESAGAVAIVSHTLPGDLNGQAVMLDRLTSGPCDVPWLFIDTDRKARARPQRPNWMASYPVGTPFLLRKLFRAPRCHPQLYRLLVRQRASAIARIIRHHRCRSIIGCTGGDLVDLPATVEAARLTGISAFLYYFDDYRIQWAIAGKRWSPQFTPQLQELSESHALRHACGIITPNEILADDLGHRTTLPVVIVRNPVDTVSYGELRERYPRRPIDSTRPIRIVYTGSVYGAQADSLARLCDAIDLLRIRGLSLELHLYGHYPSPDVCRMLPVEKIKFHAPVSQAGSAEIQVQADVLFLPLSFTCEYPELIRSSAPGKFGEYLAAGTPLVVHAPAESFPAAFVSRHACGAVCDMPDSQKLADTLAAMITDAGLRQAMNRRAVGLAEEFAEPKNRDRFVRFVLRA